jgi:hypothetical protein
MRGKTIPAPLRRWLLTLGERCEYCQTSEFVTGVALEADHIYPRSRGGATSQANLCRACSTCNTYKNDQIEATDPYTQEATPLFHPRLQVWGEHFAWSEDGLDILGLTACGRVTISALRMNNPRIRRARQIWVAAGWHPPVRS